MLQLGIDVGGTSAKMALLEDGREVWTGQSGFYTKPNPDQLRVALREAAGGRLGRVDSAGICVPGLMNESKTMVTLSVNVPGLMGLDLSTMVSDALGEGVPAIRVCNDAVSCATDVVHALKLTGRTLVLAMGTGIGAAVLDTDDQGRSRPLFVDGESPGHLGQLDVSCDSPVTIGPDGGAGGLEGYCGVPALRKRFGDRINDALPTLDASDPFILALARTIRIGHALYRQHHTVLAGGIGIRLKPRVDALRAVVDKHLTSIARPDRTLQTAADDFHAARGAARLAAGSV
jgi:predicted NBD/HSP70 family sugar kinase